jgi:hypothetical protein
MSRPRFGERLLVLLPVLCLPLACDSNGPSDAQPTLTSLSAGFDRTCAVDHGGLAYCWGSLGSVALAADPPCDGDACYRLQPAPLDLGFRIRDLRLASNIFGDATCVTTTGSQLYCWGALLVGYDGGFLIAAQPRAMGGPAFSSVRVASRHVCGLTAVGEAYCWGDYRVGVRGAGEPLADQFVRPDLVPNLVDGGFTFTQLALGLGNSCGLAASGAAYCWGSEVALGNPDAALTPLEQCGYTVPPPPPWPLLACTCCGRRRSRIHQYCRRAKPRLRSHFGWGGLLLGS